MSTHFQTPNDVWRDLENCWATRDIAFAPMAETRLTESERLLLGRVFDRIHDRQNVLSMIWNLKQADLMDGYGLTIISDEDIPF